MILSILPRNRAFRLQKSQQPDELQEHDVGRDREGRVQQQERVQTQHQQQQHGRRSVRRHLQVPRSQVQLLVRVSRYIETNYMYRRRFPNMRTEPIKKLAIIIDTRIISTLDTYM